MQQLENQQAKATRVEHYKQNNPKFSSHFSKTNLNGHSRTKCNNRNEEYNTAKREHVENPDN